MIQYKKLYFAANATEAYLIKGILEQNAIETNLMGENLSIGIGELPVDVIKVEIKVNADKFSEALKIIHDYEKTLRESVQEMNNWECEKCKKINPENFEICWSCQVVRIIEK